MTIKVIHASGSPYDMGFMIGQALKDTVHEISVHNEEFVAAEKRWTDTDYVTQMLEATRQAFPKYIRELEGIADGMEISFDRAFVWNCRGDLRWPEDISPAVAAGLTEGCTSVIMPGNDSDPAIIGHNEDGSHDYKGHCFWLSASPDDGPAFESFLYPGMIAGHSMGANAAGIVQTINNIRVHDLKPGIPRHFICRAILESQTMSEALGQLQRKDRASGFHHNLGSAKENTLISVEAPASACSIKEVALTASVHANHLVFDDLSQIDQEVTQSSSGRQNRAEQLNEEGVLAKEGITGILFDQHPKEEILRVPSDGGDDYGQTLATGLFEMFPEQLNIQILNPLSKEIEYSTVLPVT